MPDKDLTQAKLIILYILLKVPGVSGAALQDWSLASLYVDYFTFVLARDALIRDGLITGSTRKNERRTDAFGKKLLVYDITPEGTMILEQLMPGIPPAIRAYLSAAVGDWKKDAGHQQSVGARYFTDANGAFHVHLTLSDGTSELVDLKLLAPDEASAKKMCRQWDTATADTYTSLLHVFLD